MRRAGHPGDEQSGQRGDSRDNIRAAVSETPDAESPTISGTAERSDAITRFVGYRVAMNPGRVEDTRLITCGHAWMCCVHAWSVATLQVLNFGVMPDCA